MDGVHIVDKGLHRLVYATDRLVDGMLLGTFLTLQSVQRLLDIVGIEDEATFTRSTMINASEEITTVLQAAQYLGDDYVTRKVLSILGDADKADGRSFPKRQTHR